MAGSASSWNSSGLSSKWLGKGRGKKKIIISPFLVHFFCPHNSLFQSFAMSVSYHDDPVLLKPPLNKKYELNSYHV